MKFPSKSFGCIVLVFLHSMLGAQNRKGNGRPPPKSLTGIVLDEQERPIPYAAIALYKLPDSNMVRGVATEENGRFKINARKGKFYAEVSFLSYKNKIISNIIIGNNDIDLGQVQLISNSLTTEEVTLTADRKQMELKLDKRVFNVGKDLNNTGKQCIRNFRECSFCEC